MINNRKVVRLVDYFINVSYNFQIRNGAGRFEMGHRQFVHPFDGFAKLSSFEIRSSRELLFSSKFLQTKFYHESLRLHDIAPYVLAGGANPPFSVPQRFKALLNGIDNPNVNIIKIPNDAHTGDDFVAIADFWNGYKINMTTLETAEYIIPDAPFASFFTDPKLVPLPSSAHPVPEYNTTCNKFTFALNIAGWSSR